MERPIAYDKLAREDRLVRMRAREVAQLKVDQVTHVMDTRSAVS